MSTKEFASKLVREAVAVKSYGLWKDGQFRDVVGFSKLTNKEQDKIFNNLQITALLYVLFFLEEKAKKGRDGSGVVYSNVAEYTVQAFLEMMSEAELTEREVRLWQKLIATREREYKKDLKYILKESEKWDVFEGRDKLLRETWGRVVTLSFGLLKHVREEGDPIRDPLWVLVRRWLVGIEAELAANMESTEVKELKVLN